MKNEVVADYSKVLLMEKHYRESTMSKVLVTNKWKNPYVTQKLCSKRDRNCVNKKMKNELVADYGEHSV